MMSSYVPRRCGIATFSHDLSTGLANSLYDRPLSECNGIGIIAMNDVVEGYSYGPEVVYEIRHHSKEDYRAAADYLNNSKFDVICIQHEYGIYGGDAGEYLLAMLDRLNKPVVTTLHTVLAEPTPRQKEVLSKLCARAGGVVVMAHRAKKMLGDVFDVPDEKIHLVHHGVPDVPFGDTAPFKKRFEVSGRPTILTFGLLSPNKGIETMIDALAKVVPDHPDVAYIVLGATHPHIRKESGESYRLSLEGRALELGIEENVFFHNRYVALDDLCDYLQAADIYVTPYRAKEQITSGTLAFAVASGLAVVSTPYWYAEEILADGRGVMVDFGDVDGFANSINTLLSDDLKREKIRKSAYDFGRQMIWKNVAQDYASVFSHACDTYQKPTDGEASREKPAMRLSLPEVRLDHLRRMTDDTGLLQHAVHATPDRRHGYSIDDVARGMIVTAMHYSLFRDESVLKLFHVYLSYIHYARLDNNRFHNFMSFDRRWIDDMGGDDCQGRVLWSLGYVVSHPPDELSAELCRTLFQQSIGTLEETQWDRSRAFAIIGCYYYLRKYGDDARVMDLVRHYAEGIHASFERNRGDDWPWFEDIVTYENARIPQALLFAGLLLDEKRFLDSGITSLDWLIKIQTSKEGRVSLIGNDGWYRRGQEIPRFDQQPVEIAALMGACKAGFRASNDNRYLVEMRRCFSWFLGTNDIGQPMVDFKSRGCFDGLMPDAVNANQGAESLLSWLMTLLIMHELQTGAPILAG